MLFSAEANWQKLFDHVDIKVPVRALGAAGEGNAASPMDHGSMPGMNMN